MRKKWNLLIGVVAALMMMVGVVACAGITSPPQDLIAKNDHAGLEAWYMKEAAHLRQRAKDMTVMAEEYRKNPGLTMRGGVPPKMDMIQHCQNFAGIYTKAADEAEVIARGHRDMKDHS